MNAPTILAIRDVHISALPEQVEYLLDFYRDLVGLDLAEQVDVSDQLVFRGYPRSGPQIVVTLKERQIQADPRPPVLIQVSSLTDCAEQMMERNLRFTWCHGWAFYDRRLSVLDPAGNRVDLVTSHSFVM